MIIKSVGVVSGVNSYMKGEEEVGTVSVGCGDKAFNIRTPEFRDYMFGDVVCVIGDFISAGKQSFLQNGRLHIASAEERAELLGSVGRGFDATVDPYSLQAVDE